MHTNSLRLSLALVGAIALTAPYSAQAGPDSEGCGTIIESEFGAYEVQKCFEVYADTNPDNPVAVPGNFTFVYTLDNQNSSFTSIIQFYVETPGGGSVTGAGFIGGSGDVEPSTTNPSIAGQVLWEFLPAGIAPGTQSAPLYILSPYGPGAVTDTMVVTSDDFGLDETSACIGPVTAPPPIACTIGFWKNREDGKKGLLKFFPDGDFDAVKAEAVAISSVFATEAELVDALTSKGNRTIEERAKQQLAALLLNVAAGNLYPANMKCRLFLGTNGTQIDLDGDGVADISLEDALTSIESDILSGDPSLQGDAHDLADDINNGIGVIDATMFN